MSIEVVCTPYGPPARERLGEQIAALKNGDPLAPVTVVVPTNIAGLATRRALGARVQGIAAVNFLKLFDLADRLAGRRMIDEYHRKPLSDTIISATVRSVLGDDPGLFHASAHHPATEQALVRSYRDLRDLPDEGLSELAGQSTRAADVVRICRQVRTRLKGRWYDGQDLNHAAIAALDTGPPRDMLGELGPVVVYLPQRVTGSQGRLISKMAQHTPLTVIVGLTDDEKADAQVLESVGRMGATPASPLVESPRGEQRIISAASRDEEVKVAVREVVDAARAGIPLGRIAVLCGGGSPVIRHLQEQLNAADIQYNGPSGRTLADSLMGRGLLALLNLENRDFRRDEVFALLSAASPTVSDRDTDPERDIKSAIANPSGREPAPVMAWERVSRRAGIARGADQWAARLAQYAARQRQQADEAETDPDDSEYRVERLRREAEHAESLAQFMDTLIGNLSPNPVPSSWKTWCQWIRSLIDSYLGDKRHRQDWPDHEQEAADQIERILDRLANLDGIERQPHPAAFRHTLASELGALAPRVGRVGHGVLTGLIGDSLGMEPDRAILIGMAEGTFPHTPPDDPLLPDRERKAVGDDLPLLSDRLDEQHRHLLTVLASARTSTLVYARGDSRQAAEQHPSRWLLDAATALARQPVDSTSLESLADDVAADWFEHVPSLWGRVAGADSPATEQEFRLRTLARGELMGGDPVLARGAEMVSARASEQFTRFDGNLAGLNVIDLTTDALSATSLETWADCPMRFLFRYVLRVQTTEQPEDLEEMSALEKGSLIHETLEAFMKEQLKSGAVPAPGQSWSQGQRDRLQEIGIEKCQTAESRGLTGAPVYWRHQQGRIMADLDRFLHEDTEQRRRLNATPTASELGFGTHQSEMEAVAVELPNGQAVRFKGRADRVDQSGNRLLVTDYKTGKADSYRRLDESRRSRDDWDPVERGTRLQLPVYGLAAQDSIDDSGALVQTQYWFVTERGGFQTCGYPLEDDVLGRFLEVVATIVEGIEAGVFCDRPDGGSTRGRFSQRCEYCNADRLGTEEQRRAWERMQGQAVLSGYRNLAEPLPQDPDAGTR